MTFEKGVNHKRKNNGMFGKHHSEKSKQKSRISHLGKKMPPRTDKHRKNLSESLKDKPKSKNHIEKMRQTKLKLFKEGILKVWNENLTKETDERVKKYGEKGSKTKNSKEWKETIGKEVSRKASKFWKQYWKDNPELHPNRTMRNITKPQLELYLLIKKKYPEAELEYPIKTKHSIRFADIAILSLKLDIEYDGLYWHSNKKIDDLRDKQLLEVGWKTIRINKNNIYLYLNKISKNQLLH